MLRSISKQSGESVESVWKTQRTAILVATLKFKPSNLIFFVLNKKTKMCKNDQFKLLTV